METKDNGNIWIGAFIALPIGALSWILLIIGILQILQG